MTEQDKILILGIGVSEHKTDGVLRFEHYCKKFNLEYKILGDGKKWRGGDMENRPGGGQKINEILIALKNLPNRLVVICDTFDLLPVAGEKEIVEKFKKLCNPDSVLFASEVYCWPDSRLGDSYPKVTTKYRYLNSGSIMGYRDQIYNLIKDSKVRDNDDDQRYFTEKFLSGEKIVLDYNCELFQALNGVRSDIKIEESRVKNSYTNTYPVFIHGNGPSKLHLNSLDNYLSQPILPIKKNDPKVFIAAYVTRPESVDDFLTNIRNIKYDNIVVYVYDEKYNDEIEDKVSSMGFIYGRSMVDDETYDSEFVDIDPLKNIKSESNIKKFIYKDFLKTDCEYYFIWDQSIRLTKLDLLQNLLELCHGYHRVIAPLVAMKNNKCFTNFWGALDKNGYYARSNDYLKLINRELQGVWNGPYVGRCILIKRDIIENWNLNKNAYEYDRDMILASNLRKNTLFMYMVNNDNYGDILF